MKQILAKSECPYKAYLNSLGLIGEEETKYDLAVMVKELFMKNSLTDLCSTTFVKNIISPILDSLEFTLEKERIEIEETILKNTNFIAQKLSQSYTIVDTNRNIKLTIGPKDIFIKIDLILRDNAGKFFGVTIHQGKKKYTAKELHSDYSLEWYLRLKLVEELNLEFPGIRPGKLHLKACQNYDSVLDAFLIIPSIDRVAIANTYATQLTTLLNTPSNKYSCKKPDYNTCQVCPGRNLCEFFKTNTEELKRVQREKVLSSNMVLTQAQESLVNADKGIYGVLAGAGTGKTTTLANKLVAMVQAGISPSDILVITFTEKGIQELKEKINYWLSEWFIVELSAEDFPIYTFNGYGATVLKENYVRFGYTAEPRLIDSIEKTELIQAILDKFPRIEEFRYDNPLLKLFNAKGAIYQFQDVIDGLKKVSTDPVRLLNYLDKLKLTHKNDYNILKDMIDEYNNYLNSNNLIEYEDQTNCLVKICQVGYEDLFKKYSKTNIICDEFQDTDDKQLLFLRACASSSEFNSLTMVGDDSQSIFGWRGANQEIILKLDEYFKNLKNINMIENFRCTREICTLANKVNELNKNKIKKDLISNKSGQPVKLVDSSKKTSVEYTVEEINKLIKNGVNKYDIGVIARTKAELQSLNIRLQEEKIPCIVSVHEYLKDNPKIKNLIDFTKYLLDTKKTLYLAEFLQAADPDAFESQINLSKYIGEESKKIEIELEELKLTSNNIDEDLVKFFYDKIEKIDSTDKALIEFKDILNAKNFKKLEDLNIFLSKFKAFDSDLGIEKDEEAYDAITLMTPHSAKGREFKVIFGLMDKFKFGEEEDTRCLFVTITRAIEQLFLVQDVSLITERCSYKWYPKIEELLKKV